MAELFADDFDAETESADGEPRDDESLTTHLKIIADCARRLVMTPGHDKDMNVHAIIMRSDAATERLGWFLAERKERRQRVNDLRNAVDAVLGDLEGPV